jgi:hypothetical protein
MTDTPHGPGGAAGRHPGLLYGDELRTYQEQGLVHLESAYSRPGGRPGPLRPGRRARLR